MSVVGTGVTELEDRLAALLAEGALAEAATEIVRGYGLGLLGYLATMLGDDGAAREAFADFGLELWRSLPRFARRSSVKTWSYAIAYHCAQRYRRGRPRQHARPPRSSEYSRLAADVGTTSRSFARTAADRQLDVLRQALDEDERTLLILRFDRRMAWTEIAEVLEATGATPAALRKRFQRLKTRLRRLAEREGLVTSRPEA